MVTQADWIKVELTAVEVAEVQRIAVTRYQKATRARARGRGIDGSNLATHLTGVAGEAAVARYCGLSVSAADTTYREEQQRGFDIAGWEVRATSEMRRGLLLRQHDQGRFILALTAEIPVIWLAGWIDAEEGFAGARAHAEHGFVWYVVPKERLRQLAEQHGCMRHRADRWLIDPRTPFWCESCGAMHPIIEHRICRA